jgi:hypothetical protein
MVGDGREWLDAQPLPEAAREQVTIAIAMIDALDRHMAPLEGVARVCRPAGRLQGPDGALPDRGTDRGTILAELGDARRFANSRNAVPPTAPTIDRPTTTRSWCSAASVRSGTPQEKLAALEVFIDKLLPGRWSEVKRPTRQKLNGTAILELPIDQALVKANDGPPGDDDPPDGDLNT